MYKGSLSYFAPSAEWISVFFFLFLCFLSLQQIFFTEILNSIEKRQTRLDFFADFTISAKQGDMLSVWPLLVQVNLFQKYLFTGQLTHNMTTNCSMIYEFSTRNFQEQNMSTTYQEHVKNTLFTQIVLNV